MMRTASALLIATLLTTSVISGTFAKYVTEASASDTARVAKWGVTVSAGGSLFGQNYVPNTASESKDEISASVQNSVDVTIAENYKDDNIVVPGTKNTTGLTLAVAGTPEVANKVEVSKVQENGADVALSDIYLKAGTYGVMVEAAGVTADNYANYYTESSGTYSKVSNSDSYSSDTKYYTLNDEVTIDADYYPLVWTLKEDQASDGTTYTTANALYEAVKTAFNTSAGSQNNPNVEIDKKYTITWAWDFDANGAGTNDGADTILGNLIAAEMETDESWAVVKKSNNDFTSALVKETDYSLNAAFNVKITVTQVD